MATNKINAFLKEAIGLFKSDKEERTSAAKSPDSIILNAKDVKGEYDSHRALMTTLGGISRAITSDDLVTFRQNIKTMQSKFKGGIKARQVLDLSLQIDRVRARSEIRVAVPMSANNGLVKFFTNAGPESKVVRHYVNVKFLSFGAAASGGRDTPSKMANWLKTQSLKFDCDCGRHRYWYRYISTIGDFNAGRSETGYPKIRNPMLHGVACKHVLRVMAEIESSGAVLGFLTRLIEKAQDSDSAKASHKTKQKDAEDWALKQAKNSRNIHTTESRAQASKVAKDKKELKAAAVPSTAPKRPTVSTRRAATVKPDTPVTTPPSGLTPGQIAMAAQMGLTHEQVRSLMNA